MKTDLEWLTEMGLCHKCRKAKPALGSQSHTVRTSRRSLHCRSNGICYFRDALCN